MQLPKNIFFVASIQKKALATASAFFQLYSPCGEFYAQVRDMSFGRDMRFARWKLQGEYNITVSVANNITTSFASNITLTKSAYH